MTVAPLSIRQQSEFIEALVMRCKTHHGIMPEQAWVFFSAEDVEILAALAKRLERMAPHEGRIRKMVVGR